MIKNRQYVIYMTYYNYSQLIKKGENNEIDEEITYNTICIYDGISDYYYGICG